MNTCEGQCQCGAVSYTATLPSLFCVHCHCEYCRRAQGSAFVTWFAVPDERFALTDSAGELRWYQSSRQGQRGFCGQCGTTLLFRSALFPGETHIVRASVAGAIDRDPTSHVFFDQKVGWLHVDDGLKRYNSDSPRLATFNAVEKA